MQLILGQGKVSLFSRTGDDIAQSFPDLVDNVFGEAVLDGELLVGQRFRAGAVQRSAAAAQPQDRDRASIWPTIPAFVRVYDMLFDGSEDIRALPWTERRQRLEAWFARNAAAASRSLRGPAVCRLGGSWPRCAGAAPPSTGMKG